MLKPPSATTKIGRSAVCHKPAVAEAEGKAVRGRPLGLRRSGLMFDLRNALLHPEVAEQPLLSIAVPFARDRRKINSAT